MTQSSTLCGMVKWVSANRLSSNKQRWCSTVTASLGGSEAQVDWSKGGRPSGTCAALTINEPGELLQWQFTAMMAAAWTLSWLLLLPLCFLTFPNNKKTGRATAWLMTCVSSFHVLCRSSMHSWQRWWQSRINNWKTTFTSFRRSWHLCGTKPNWPNHGCSKMYVFSAVVCIACILSYAFYAREQA